MGDLIDALPNLVQKKPLDSLLDQLPDLSQGVGQGQAALIAGGYGLDRLAAGLRAFVPAPIRDAVDSVGQTLGMGQPPSIDPSVQAANTAAIKPVQDQYPITTALAESAPMMAGGPLAQAAMAGLSYGTPGERGVNAGSAFLGAKLGQAVARVLGPSSMSTIPSNGAEDFFNYATSAGNKWGIPLRVAQTTDSTPVKIVDAVLGNLPGSSSVINAAKNASYQGFNKAVANTFGADTSKLTPELLGQAQQTIGSNIGSIADRSTMVADPTFAQQFAAASSRIGDELVGDDAALASKWFNNVQQKIGPDGTMSGQQYKALRGKIGEAAAAQGGTVANVLGDLKSALTGAMDRSIAPEDSAAWQNLNRQYFNVKQVANAAKNSPEGNLSPSQLLNAVNAAQKSSRFGGGNDLAELARWAKPVIGDTIPNSGTAQREFYQKLLTSPLATIGTAGGAMYGLNQMGVGPLDAPLGLLGAYAASRGMAGAPASAFTRSMLQRGGGLLGYDLASQY